jgi:hypothetical protein
MYSIQPFARKAYEVSQSLNPNWFVGPIHSADQWALGALSRGLSGRSCNLKTRLVTTFRMHCVESPHPPRPRGEVLRPADVGSMFLRNACIYLPIHAALLPTSLNFGILTAVIILNLTVFTCIQHIVYAAYKYGLCVVFSCLTNPWRLSPLSASYHYTNQTVVPPLAWPRVVLMTPSCIPLRRDAWNFGHVRWTDRRTCRVLCKMSFGASRHASNITWNAQGFVKERLTSTLSARKYILVFTHLLLLASPGVTYADRDYQLSIILLILKCRL